MSGLFLIRRWSWALVYEEADLFNSGGLYIIYDLGNPAVLCPGVGADVHLSLRSLADGLPDLGGQLIGHYQFAPEEDFVVASNGHDHGVLSIRAAHRDCVDNLRRIDRHSWVPMPAVNLPKHEQPQHHEHDARESSNIDCAQELVRSAPLELHSATRVSPTIQSMGTSDDSHQSDYKDTEPIVSDPVLSPVTGPNY